MNFDNFLSQAWTDHAKNAAEVADRLPQGAGLVEKNDQIPALANLIMHVTGEHLGRWAQGVNLVSELKKLPSYQPGTESEKAITRSIAALELAAGDANVLAGLSLSDQVRVLALGASALSEQGDPVRAHSYFRLALEKAQAGVTKEDPANRALAVSGNNLACALEEKTNRSSQDVELMILAAEAGRKYWAIAGTWKEILWAEYRLSMTYLKATNLQKALEHAQQCIEGARENNAGPMELFYGYESLALVEKARGNPIGAEKAVVHAKDFFQQLGESDKAWCKDSLQKLEAATQKVAD